MSDMKNIWQRIAKALDIELPPPATQAELDDFVAKCGFITLPDEMRESYLVTNGGWGQLMFISDITFNTLEQTYHYGGSLNSLIEDGGFGIKWDEKAYPDSPVKLYHWSPKWLPIMSFGEFHWCVDCDPTPKGTYGQIIKWDHETGGGGLVATGLKVLLERIAERLEKGLLPSRSEIEAEQAAIDAGNFDDAIIEDKYDYFFHSDWGNIGTPEEKRYD